MDNLITIGQAAEILGVNISTLRRWDKIGRLKAVRSNGNHRYFSKKDLMNYILSLDILKLSQNWVMSAEPYSPPSVFYCQNSYIFQARLQKLEGELSKINKFKTTFSLLTSMVGEIGNNSFDHNLGQWKDVPGIFFACDLKQRRIFLADRGQGVFKTLFRVKPSLKDDKEALLVAFTEIISGRSPESRGNGLKYVRQIISHNDFSLLFESGLAKLQIKSDNSDLQIKLSKKNINGCWAMISF